MTGAATMDRLFDTFPKLLVENARVCSDAPASREKDFGIWLSWTWSEVTGEVVTTQFNPEYPLLRFATGDLSTVLPGASPCGRTNMRLKGWMGRADQTTKVKGMFVHPAQIAEIVNRQREVLKARPIVDQRDGIDVMTLSCEIRDVDATASGPTALIAEIAQTIEAVCKLKGEVGFSEPGNLPNDGKVIEDIRDHD